MPDFLTPENLAAAAAAVVAWLNRHHVVGLLRRITGLTQADAGADDALDAVEALRVIRRLLIDAGAPEDAAETCCADVLAKLRLFRGVPPAR